jgi:hypothetical protein
MPVHSYAGANFFPYFLPFAEKNCQKLILLRLKGIAQRILSGSILCSNNPCGKLEARLFFFLNFKGTPSQEEHKTIFSGKTICRLALSDQ